MKPNLILTAALCSLTVITANAQPTSHSAGTPPSSATSADELAKQLTNPVASLISLPFQNNFDFGIGANDGWRYTLNVQPVIPFSLSEDWNLISRTIVPFIHQEDVIGSSSQSGLSDTVQSLFFSPAKPGPGGLIWGAGPVFLLPTATDDLLGADKFGLGPTAVGLRQSGPWTYGALVNHIWSVAGSDRVGNISATFLQPFLAYTTKDAWTFALNTESTYDWEAEQWSIPINVAVSKVFTIGGQGVSVTGGVRYWAESPNNGPEGFGGRVSLTFLFPK